MATTHIFLVEDHPVMRQMLRAYLEEEPGLSVCGEAATAAEALEQVAKASPDLVLIDVSLPGMSGIELAGALRDRHPDLLLAMLSGHSEKSYAEQARAVGACGYILKGNADELSEAIQQIVRGGSYLSARIGGWADGE